MPTPLVLSNIQMRVERSIYEAIRVQFVSQGYLPDITTSGRYPASSTGGANWEADLAIVTAAKKFAVEVFGDSSSLQKGLKRVPRIGIIPRRIMPGDIGKDIRGGFAPNPLDPDNTIFIKPTYQSANLHIDINVVPETAEQDRLVNAVIASALSTLNYLQFYDNPTEYFLIRQFNFYDLPDNKNGIAEKVYSYEIPDLYLYEGLANPVPLIEEITVNIDALGSASIVGPTGNLVGPYVSEDKIFINLSGIEYSQSLSDENGNFITTENGLNIQI